MKERADKLNDKMMSNRSENHQITSQSMNGTRIIANDEQRTDKRKFSPEKQFSFSIENDIKVTSQNKARSKVRLQVAAMLSLA